MLSCRDVHSLRRFYSFSFTWLFYSFLQPSLWSLFEIWASMESELVAFLSIPSVTLPPKYVNVSSAMSPNMQIIFCKACFYLFLQQRTILLNLSIPSSFQLSLLQKFFYSFQRLRCICVLIPFVGIVSSHFQTLFAKTTERWCTEALSLTYFPKY